MTECPICMDTIQNLFKSSCCNNKFCNYCFYKASVTSKSCPLCRNPKHYDELIKKGLAIISDIKNYEPSREHALGYSRIKQKKFNNYFKFLREHDYILSLYSVRNELSRKYFDWKFDINWAEWKELDNLMKDYNIDSGYYMLEFIN